MSDPTAELWLVRHGETEWSRDHRHTSVTDLDLTPEGERVAGQLSERLAGVDFDMVLTSPRLRARRTAATVSSMRSGAMPRSRTSPPSRRASAMVAKPLE